MTAKRPDNASSATLRAVEKLPLELARTTLAVLALAGLIAAAASLQSVLLATGWPESAAHRHAPAPAP